MHRSKLQKLVKVEIISKTQPVAELLQNGKCIHLIRQFMAHTTVAVLNSFSEQLQRTVLKAGNFQKFTF